MESAIDARGGASVQRCNLPHALSVLSSTRHPAAQAGSAVICSPIAMEATIQAAAAGAAVPTTVGASGDDTSTASSQGIGGYEEIGRLKDELLNDTQYHISSLVQTLKRREEEFEAVRLQLRKTEEDYQFNYNLIKERDAALSDAAKQLQTLYSELKRRKSESAAAVKRIEDLDQEVQKLRKRLRETEEQKEQSLQRAQQTHELREEQLREDIRDRSAALEEEKKRLHDEYLKRFKSLDDTRAEVTEKFRVMATEEEEKWRRKVHGLETQLHASLSAREALQRERCDMEARLNERNQAYTLLKQEKESLQQQYQLALTDAEDQKQKFEQRLSECTVAMSQGIVTAEGVVRQQVHRASVLEVENGRLHGQVAELQERLKAVQLQLEEDARRFTDERRTAQDQYSGLTMQIEEQRRSFDESSRQHALRIRQLERDLEAECELRKEVLTRVEQLQGKCETSEREHAEQQREVERLRRELQISRQEEKFSSVRAQEVQQNANEEVLAAHREVESVRTELQLQQRRLLEVQERAQADSARLTRELHASEAARKAMEDQCSLLEKGGNHQALIESLRNNKEALEQKVLDLERTNAAIREQVSSFTMELKNDPAVKAAKEMQHRVQELEADLLSARESVEQLQCALREKDDEISRCQIEMLRMRQSDTILKERRESEAQHLQGLCRATMAPCQQFGVHISHQKHQRSGKSRADSSLRPPAFGSAESDSCSSDSNPKGRNARDRMRSAGNHSRSSRRDSSLIREVESWQKRCLQLDHNIRNLLREREHLKRELQLTRQDVDALTSEKHSLVDLNSLLKVQLREAYHTALECSHQRQRQQHQQAGNNSSNSVADGGAVPVAESSGSRQRLTVDNVLIGTTESKLATSHLERLALLEEELAAVKDHVLHRQTGRALTSRHRDASTSLTAQRTRRTQPQRERQRGHEANTVPSSRSANYCKTPVVKRGPVAVRHYGYL
uniref:Uncharacterized protein n=1 Tax=Trypanosoma congolense (strain IL3000) TaxID=1068625 RepID=G0UY59_TRYCI|nr:conserved hypothetical protein [Trypanosoma congolense IL3000]